MNFVLLILTMALLTSCQPTISDSMNESGGPGYLGATSVETMQIAPYKATCMSERGPDLCFVVQQAGEPEAFVYGPIDQLAWQWGHEIQANIVVNENAPTSSVAPSQHYSLQYVVTDQRVSDGTTFDMDLTPAFVNQSLLCHFGILKQVTFRTQTQDLCDQLNRGLAAHAKMVGTFGFTNLLSQPIVLLALKQVPATHGQLWSTIIFKSYPPPVGLCREPDLFSVAVDGKFKFSSCHLGKLEGQISDAELADLTTRARAVQTADLSAPLICDNIFIPEILEMRMTYFSGQSSRLFVQGAFGMCTKAFHTGVLALENKMVRLVDRYVPKTSP